MKELTEKIADLGEKASCDHLECGLAYGLVRAIESEIGKVRSEVQELIFRVEALEQQVRPALLEKQVDGHQCRLYKIEQEQGGHNTRIEALESKCGDIGWFMGQVKLNLRSIKALEDNLKKLKLDTFLETIPPEPMPPDVPTDKDGKPLEKWDVISYKINCPGILFHGRKCFGQFHHKDGDKIYGYWQEWKTWKLVPQGLEKDLMSMYQDRVTFEFRPRLPDQEEMDMAKETYDTKDHLRLIAKLKETDKLVGEADKVVGTKTKEVKDAD